MSNSGNDNWLHDELRRIAEADDLHISPFREDGVTYGTPTWIWSVAVDGAPYVRGYNGKNSRWLEFLHFCRENPGNDRTTRWVGQTIVFQWFATPGWNDNGLLHQAATPLVSRGCRRFC